MEQKFEKKNYINFKNKIQEIIYKIRNYIKILKNILIKEHPMSQKKSCINIGGKKSLTDPD